MHCTTKALLTGAFGPALRRSTSLPQAFLVPAFTTATSSTASFSTTASTCARKDGNPSRGVSALRRTGLGRRQRLSVSPENLPRPVRDSKSRSAIAVDENHGLYDFFNANRSALMTPTELAAHGRGWTVYELRRKDWEDLHRLWWVCVKEMNRLRTFKRERERAGNMYGDYEAEGRGKEVRQTMRSIKFVLTERWYTWENARNVAMEDEEVNLYADPEKGERAYIPAPDREPQLDASEPDVERVDGDVSTPRTAEYIPPSHGAGGSESAARV